MLAAIALFQFFICSEFFWNLKVISEEKMCFDFLSVKWFSLFASRSCVITAINYCWFSLLPSLLFIFTSAHNFYFHRLSSALILFPLPLFVCPFHTHSVLKNGNQNRKKIKHSPADKKQWGSCNLIIANTTRHTTTSKTPKNKNKPKQKRTQTKTKPSHTNCSGKNLKQNKTQDVNFHQQQQQQQLISLV